MSEAVTPTAEGQTIAVLGGTGPQLRRGTTWEVPKADRAERRRD